MNWTPGPWRACLDESDGGNESTEIRKEDYLIATVYGARDFPCLDEEDRDSGQFAANACLIALAPEMYEALSDIVTGHWTTKYKNLGQALLKAEDVLAQARGESEAVK